MKKKMPNNKNQVWQFIIQLKCIRYGGLFNPIVHICTARCSSVYMILYSAACHARAKRRMHCNKLILTRKSKSIDIKWLLLVCFLFIAFIHTSRIYIIFYSLFGVCVPFSIYRDQRCRKQRKFNFYQRINYKSQLIVALRKMSQPTYDVHQVERWRMLESMQLSLSRPHREISVVIMVIGALCVLTQLFDVCMYFINCVANIRRMRPVALTVAERVVREDLSLSITISMLVIFILHKTSFVISATHVQRSVKCMLIRNQQKNHQKWRSSGMWRERLATNQIKSIKNNCKTRPTSVVSQPALFLLLCVNVHTTTHRCTMHTSRVLSTRSFIYIWRIGELVLKTTTVCPTFYCSDFDGSGLHSTIVYVTLELEFYSCFRELEMKKDIIQMIDIWLGGSELDFL